ncbi:MAG: cation:proton antiporter [Saprospiraceae bacterium]|nr:cation:proton antiporter [Saprospiraceae bacterium]
MDDSNNLIIVASLVIILSFFFSALSKKTNIPSVLMLIVLGIVIKLGLDAMKLELDFFPVLSILGTVGLIMIVLEAALELELKPEKLWPILNALVIALIGLLASTWVAALLMNHFIKGMTMQVAWIYATPLSILSSAIIIPSVTNLNDKKKEFHIYESTFSDILGIMLFYFLTEQVGSNTHSSGFIGFLGNVGLTITISVVASYLIVLIFQHIKGHVKLFLLISVLLLLYALGKKMHLSSLIIILIFGLVIGNMKLFFRGKLSKWLHLEKAKSIYEDLHVITMETAFVVRTFFFVIFGITISLASLLSVEVAMISGLIVGSIYLIRFVLLRLFLGSDIVPQLFIAPRGLITVLLFYAIPDEVKVKGFESGILLFIIIATSLIMTFAMIYDKRRTNKAVNRASGTSVGYTRWKAPTINSKKEETH